MASTHNPASVLERTDTTFAAVLPVRAAAGDADRQSGGAGGARWRRTLIEPEKPFRWADVDEVFTYRSLLVFLIWKDIKVRYAQTVMGAGWAVLQPVVPMVVFTMLFGRFAGIPSDGVPYAVFSLAALVPWTYFSQSLLGASNSLIANTNLITKVYFPRIVIPYSQVIAGLVDLSIASGVLLLVMLVYGFVPPMRGVALLPLVVLVAMMTAGGVGCWLAALNIQYRDVKYGTPFLVQIWMYASPIVYPVSMIPESYRLLYALNPMVFVIEGFRSALLGTPTIGASHMALSAMMAAVLFVSGTWYFRGTERVFADVA